MAMIYRLKRIPVLAIEKSEWRAKIERRENEGLNLERRENEGLKIERRENEGLKIERRENRGTLCHRPLLWHDDLITVIVVCFL